ncbi:MFS transporter [Trichothermofontia sp.]
MTSSAPTPKTLWPQVWGLAAVNGTITLTWVIYNLYLLQLLTQFGFPSPIATVILVVENLLSAVMEPVMGGCSDRAQYWVGSHFPFIAIGIVLASACFIGIPVFVVFGDPAMRWVLPVLLIAWALAMSVFRSPALALLGRYATQVQLPQAASVLTLVGGVFSAMGPLANQFILGLGPVVAFSVGSLSMLLAATVLRLTGPDQQVASPVPVERVTLPVQTSRIGGPLPVWMGALGLRLGLVFISGAGMGMGFRLLLTGFPQVLKAQVGLTNVSLILGCLFMTLSVLAVPAGQVATRLGNRTAMVAGGVGMAVLTGLTLMVHHLSTAVILTIALGAAFSLVSNGVLPFALAMVPTNHAGLGTGLYFGGGALAASLLGIFFNPGTAWPPIGVIGISVGAFLTSSLVIAVSYQLADPVREAPSTP